MKCKVIVGLRDCTTGVAVVKFWKTILKTRVVKDTNCTDMLACLLSGFGGLEVVCWPLVPKFAGTDPAEAVGFFRTKKSSARLLSEGK